MAGNQTLAGASTPDVSTHSRAIKAAEIETKMTRRYCMKATSLASAPKAPAISTMAVAPPGAEPQTAVVPGRILKRLMNQPRKLEATRVDVTTLRNKRPLVEKGREDGRRQRGRDKASDQRLRAGEAVFRHPDSGAVGAGKDRRQHRAEQHGGGQAGVFEQGGKEQRNCQQRNPLSYGMQISQTLRWSRRGGRLHLDPS